MDRYVPYVAPFYSNCFPTTITTPNHTHIHRVFLFMPECFNIHTHSVSYIRAIFSFNILPKATLASGLKESGIDPLYHLSQSCQNTTRHDENGTQENQASKARLNISFDAED